MGLFGLESESDAASRYAVLTNQLGVLTKAVGAMAGSQSTQIEVLRQIMTGITDLTAAVTALQTASAAAAAAIETELAKIAAANTGNDPAIAAAVTAISGVTAALTAEAAKVTP